VNGEAVLRRFKIPILFRVGERPAGADSGDDFEIVVFKRVAWDRAARIGRRGEVVGLRDENALGAGGEGGAFVRKKLVGLTNVSLLEPSAAFERFGERKMEGSMFSESMVSKGSKSKVAALRLVGEERVFESAIAVVRFMVV